MLVQSLTELGLLDSICSHTAPCQRLKGQVMWPYACGSAVHVLQKWFPVLNELLPLPNAGSMTPSKARYHCK